LFRRWYEVQYNLQRLSDLSQTKQKIRPEVCKFASFKVLAALYSKIAFFWDTKTCQSGDPILAFWRTVYSGLGIRRLCVHSKSWVPSIPWHSLISHDTALYPMTQPYIPWHSLLSHDTALYPMTQPFIPWHSPISH